MFSGPHPHGNRHNPGFDSLLKEFHAEVNGREVTSERAGREGSHGTASAPRGGCPTPAGHSDIAPAFIYKDPPGQGLIRQPLMGARTSQPGHTPHALVSYVLYGNGLVGAQVASPQNPTLRWSNL